MFILAKIIWWMTQPLSIIVVGMVVTLLALVLHFYKTAIVMLVLCLIAIILVSYSNIGAVAMAKLEQRFMRPDLPVKVDGIIVLGGYMEGQVNKTRGTTDMKDAGDRLVETLRLMRLYPQAKIVISGGGSDYGAGSESCALGSKRLLAELGIDDAQVIYEDRSRNTYENALFTLELVDPQPGETWLLVTSAYHMPRSIGIFRHLGVDLVAWPSDYRTRGNESFGLSQGSADNAVSLLSIAVREWIGLVAYYWLGRTDSVFPAQK